MTDFDTKTSSRPKIKETIAKLKKIHIELRQNRDRLHQKIEALNSKSELQNTIEAVKRDAEIRASGLEAEVKRLRENLESIKDVLGLDLDKCNSVNY